MRVTRATGLAAGSLALALVGCAGPHGGEEKGALGPPPESRVARADDAGIAGRTLGEAEAGWLLRAPDGEAFPLGRALGRPVFLNLWATWCPPCVEELRSIDALARRPGAEAAVFLLVSPEEPGRVREFSRRAGLDLPLLVEETRMPTSLGLEALPTTWILDPGGRVVLVHRGAADWDRDDVEALLAALAGGR